ncbi:spondin-1-like [Trichogramma pretiosum]|uniref:spondin-1-like n=1 Tax=Trichogramma pretiosum TaxID=7493 RepID=UPI000C719093|nr:spondin-1-like [Trichogramma pretiosum]
METGQEVVDSLYTIQLSISKSSGALRTYFPNARYNVTIRSKLKSHTFTQFYFGVWSLGDEEANSNSNAGSLELSERELSKFHNGPYCINRVVDGPVSLAKQSLSIGWQSPKSHEHCVEFRAAIKETELRYHTANLTVCPDSKVILDDPGKPLASCCACDQAKYKLAFEGLWSRYTHPKYFPRREWLAVFPTVIGISHSQDYAFWRPYQKATEGLKSFVETGHTHELETELKSHSAKINTLIKFRGTNYQNKSRTSYSLLRVNQKQHVLSVVAKIDPSPDWFVGVSALELCRSDCSWIESKSLNLYAYDAGVQNGLWYEDIGEETEPQGNIENINSSWPVKTNGKQSPFYDETNNAHEIRPLARIHLTRLRGSEKSCLSSSHIDDCTEAWSKWSECSVDCGAGTMKRRRLIKQSKIGLCDVPLEESKVCEGEKPKCLRELSRDDCAVTDWGEWSKCTKSCGQETIIRSRSFKWRDNAQQCQEKFGKIELVEKADCGNPPCPEDNYLCVDDRYSSWTEWSPCRRVRDKAIRFRHRTIKENLRRAHLDVLDGDSDYGYSACLFEKDICQDFPTALHAEETHDNFNNDLNSSYLYSSRSSRPSLCFLPPDSGQCPGGRNDNSHKYYYDHELAKCLPFKYTGCGGNDNRFNDNKACAHKCIIHGKKIDCVMSEWSNWSDCKSCIGFRSREKTVLVHPENGGRMCPLTKVHRESCKNILKNC